MRPVCEAWAQGWLWPTPRTPSAHPQGLGVGSWGSWQPWPCPARAAPGSGPAHTAPLSCFFPLNKTDGNRHSSGHGGLRPSPSSLCPTATPVPPLRSCSSVASGALSRPLELLGLPRCSPLGSRRWGLCPSWKNHRSDPSCQVGWRPLPPPLWGATGPVSGHQPPAPQVARTQDSPGSEPFPGPRGGVAPPPGVGWLKPPPPALLGQGPGSPFRVSEPLHRTAPGTSVPSAGQHPAREACDLPGRQLAREADALRPGLRAGWESQCPQPSSRGALGDLAEGPSPS